MLDFLLIMIVPVIIALITLFTFKGKVLWWEFLAQVGVVALLVGLCLSFAYMGRTSDTEVWNGQVTEREHHHVSCEHSYSCNCREVCSGSGKDESCSEVCDTCYEHSYDVDWTVHASTGETVNIDREDRQGLTEPKRWDAAFPGEPWASQHEFENYIKANPDSVLLGTKGDMQKWGKLIPKYPDSIYDYYRNDPVINMGVPNVDLNAWNWLIRETNKTLGPKKQVHIIVILVPTDDASYMYALKDAWLGGKKNDVDVVIGSKDGAEIGFVQVMSWSTNKTLAVELRDEIAAAGSLQNKDTIVNAITNDINRDFVRMHMKDMKWLMRSFQPSQGALIGIFIFGTLLSLGISVWAVYADLGEDDIDHEWGHRAFVARLKYRRSRNDY